MLENYGVIILLWQLIICVWHNNLSYDQNLYVLGRIFEWLQEQLHLQGSCVLRYYLSSTNIVANKLAKLSFNLSDVVI